LTKFWIFEKFRKFVKKISFDKIYGKAVITPYQLLILSIFANNFLANTSSHLGVKNRKWRNFDFSVKNGFLKILFFSEIFWLFFRYQKNTLVHPSRLSYLITIICILSISQQIKGALNSTKIQEKKCLKVIGITGRAIRSLVLIAKNAKKLQKKYACHFSLVSGKLFVTFLGYVILETEKKNLYEMNILTIIHEWRSYALLSIILDKALS